MPVLTLALGATGLIVAGWDLWTRQPYFGNLLPYLPLSGFAGGVVAVVMAAADDACRSAGQRRVRGVGTLLRSVAVRLVIVAAAAGGIGGTALWWAETRAVREADRVDGLAFDPPLESDPDLVRLRDFTLAGLRERQALFAGLAAADRRPAPARVGG